jgi:hypothetical protein
MVKDHIKIAVTDTGGDLGAWQGNVDGRTVPLPGEELDHSESTTGELDSPILAQEPNENLLWQASDQQIDVFARLPKQFIPHRSPYRVHACLVLLQSTYER